MRSSFEQLRDALKRVYPDLRVVGDNYPIGANRERIISILFFVQISLFLCLFFSKFLFGTFGQQIPDWIDSMNSLPTYLGIFVIGNMISGQLMATGAFEIYYGDSVVWSKLETGSMPDLYSVVQKLESLGLDPRR
eukprot:comp22820_c0_seq1/m.57954 comp22820_c0_seq1/g.57954  ORF comp22820_c0_seq1/g.57954 comp22820_c0_seq1/m.57954 type:complete len:135 (-) comp22820_c0_seq1:246-650(-)